MFVDLEKKELAAHYMYLAIHWQLVHCGSLLNKNNSHIDIYGHVHFGHVQMGGGGGGMITKFKHFTSKF